MAVFAGLVMCAQTAAADKADEAEKPKEITQGETSFWEWLVEPNAAEIQTILIKARLNLQMAQGTYALWNYSGTLEPQNQANRDRALDDAIGMLRYGLKLEPNNPELEMLLGEIAHERGKLELARVTYESYLADEVPEKIQLSARIRLGRVYAQQQDWDSAVVQLRLALGTQTTAYQNEQPIAAMTLAQVYMHEDRLDEAIDLLRHHSGSQSGYYYGNYMVQFALAVAYDRDEQLTLAHETLDKIVAGSQYQNLSGVMFDPTNRRIVFTPAIDRHYFAALQFEAMGHLAEARKEWRAYARAGDDAKYRDRARAHIKGLSKLIKKKRAEAKANKGKKKVPKKPTPGPIP